MVDCEDGLYSTDAGYAVSDHNLSIILLLVNMVFSTPLAMTSVVPPTPPSSVPRRPFLTRTLRLLPQVFMLLSTDLPVLRSHSKCVREALRGVILTRFILEDG